MARQINVGLSNTIGQFINKTNTMSSYLGDLDNLDPDFANDSAANGFPADTHVVAGLNFLNKKLDSAIDDLAGDSQDYEIISTRYLNIDSGEFNNFRGESARIDVLSFDSSNGNLGRLQNLIVDSSITTSSIYADSGVFVNLKADSAYIHMLAGSFMTYDSARFDEHIEIGPVFITQAGRLRTVPRPTSAGYNDSNMDVEVILHGTGNVEYHSNTHYLDNIKSTFGNRTSPDFEMYHSTVNGAGNMIMENDTGNLIVKPSANGEIIFTDQTAYPGNYIARFQDGDAVTLYYDGVEQFRTMDGTNRATSLRVMDLTEGRVVYVGSQSELVDDTDFTYDGTTLQIPQINPANIDANEVAFMNSAGTLLTGEADFTYDGSTLEVPSINPDNIGSNQVAFMNAAGTQLTGETAFTYNTSTNTMNLDNITVDTSFTMDGVTSSHKKLFTIKNNTGTVVLGGYLLSTSNTPGTP
jgi:hypothetical protein